MKEKFLIFIPAYNVEDKIFNVLNQIPKKIFRKEKVDILIINDNSKDNTKKIIIKLKKKIQI